MAKGFVIRINAKIAWEGRSNGLPPYIHAFLMFDQYNEKACNEVLEAQLAQFVRAGGIAVQKDQGQVIDIRQFPQDRMFVPMRWIVYMDVDAFNLGEELSVPDENGVERMSDGKEPLAN